MNNIRITKITFAVIFAFGLLIPGGPLLQSANAQNTETDPVKTIIVMMDEKESTLILEQQKTNSSSENISQINEEYWVMNDLLNNLTSIDPDRDFVDEWITKETQIDSLKNQIEKLSSSQSLSFVIPVLENKIVEIENEIFLLEQESIQSMILDQSVQNHLERIENDLLVSYPSIDDIGIDSEQQKVIVFLDYDNAKHANIAQSILEQFGYQNVMISTSVPTGCPSTTSKCIPLIGGLAIKRANESDARGYSGSIGYKAKDSDNNVGFVTAGHVVGGQNTIMYYYDDTSLGNATKFYERSNGSGFDVAFVQTTKTMSDDIFTGSNKVKDIRSYAQSKSDHKKGNFIYYSGATSGGDINTKIYVVSRSGMVYISGNLGQGGDSGGTVFDKDRRGNVVLFGHLISNNKYVPVHEVKASYSLTPQLR